MQKFRKEDKQTEHLLGSGFSSCVFVPPFCSGTSIVAICST